jgi:hypothetical protein
MSARPDTASGQVVSSRVPARIDRLPWSPFHPRLVVALGVAWILGAGVMVVGGLVEIVLGVAAERKALEDVARPLSVERAAAERERPAGSSGFGQQPGSGQARLTGG